MTNNQRLIAASLSADKDWMNRQWRPAMGWMYMVVCFFDFIVAPVLWSIVQVVGNGTVSTQWVPLTLQGAGFFHIAMGAILGIAAYGRTKEKTTMFGAFGDEPKRTRKKQPEEE